MKDFTSFGGINHKRERLYIHWDITTLCSYDCEYCYAKYQYTLENAWQKEAQEKTIKAVLNSIKLSTLPVFFGLLGGEPTSSRYFNLIVENIPSILKRHSDNRVYITSNLYRSKEWLKQNIVEAIPEEYHNKVKILASFHPEYIKDKKTFDEFTEKLLLLNEYFQVKINIMLVENNELGYNLWMKWLQQDEIKNRNFIIHPHLIYPDGSPFRDINEIYKGLDQFKDLYKYSKKEYIDSNNKEYNDYEVFIKDIHHFKGWTCYQNNYEISFNGTVNQLCGNNKIVSLEKHPLYFNKIKKIKGIKCPMDNCSCDGLLKCEREKL